MLGCLPCGVTIGGLRSVGMKTWWIAVPAVAVAIAGLTACGSTDTGTESVGRSSTPLMAPQSLPGGPTTHAVDAPLDDISGTGEHCFASVVEAVANRQRAKDVIADHNAEYERKSKAWEADNSKLLQPWDKPLQIKETTPKCYRISVAPTW